MPLYYLFISKLCVGDPCQLGPVVRSAKARAMGLDISLIESLSAKLEPMNTMSTVLLKQNYRWCDFSALDLQYWGNDCILKLIIISRSHQRLLELPSRLFYGDALKPCAKEEFVRPPEWKELQTDSTTSANEDNSLANMLFYGVRGQQV